MTNLTFLGSKLPIGLLNFIVFVIHENGNRTLRRRFEVNF